MRLSQLATVALLGTTLGTGLAVGTPSIFNASLPAMAQTGDYGPGFGASEDPNAGNGYTPSPVNPGYRQSPTWNNPKIGNKQNQAALLRELNLSPAQMQKMRSIRAQYKDQIRDRQQQVKQLKEELLSLKSNGSSSSSELRAKSQEFRRLRSEVRNMRSQQLMTMRQILNPNQQSRLDEFLASRKDNFSQERPNRRNRLNSGYSPDYNPNYTPNDNSSYTPNDNSSYTPNYKSGDNSRYDSNYNPDYNPTY